MAFKTTLCLSVLILCGMANIGHASAELDQYLTDLESTDSKTQLNAVTELLKNPSELSSFYANGNQDKVIKAISRAVKSSQADVIALSSMLFFQVTGKLSKSDIHSVERNTFSVEYKTLHDSFINNTSSQDNKVRENSLIALSVFSPSQSIENTLLDRWNVEEDKKVRRNILALLGTHQYTSDSSLDVIYNALNDHDPVIRAYAAKSIITMKPDSKRSIPLIISSLENDNDTFSRNNKIKAIIAYAEEARAYLPDIEKAIETFSNDQEMYRYLNQLLDKKVRVHAKAEDATAVEIQKQEASPATKEQETTGVSEAKRPKMIETMHDSVVLKSVIIIFVISLLLLILYYRRYKRSKDQ